jgi:hypothetical protein
MEPQINSELATLLGIDKMSESEKTAFLERTGSLIIDAAIGRLLLSLEPEQVNKIEAYVDAAPETEDIFAYFLKTYPDFQSIVEEEVAAFQSEATKIVSE